MKKFYSNIHKLNKKNLIKASKILSNSGVVGIPTETVYGLAANAYSNKGVKKIFKIKKRPNYNPVIVHYYSIKDLKKDCFLNNDFKKLYKKFCPGPLTFVLKKRSESKLSNYVSANKENIAVRFPKHTIAKKLLKKLNFPLAAPSANISSKLSPVSASDVREEFKSKVKLIIDGGRCRIGIESTIIDLSGKPCILRPGGLEIEKIQKVLKKKITIKKNVKNIKSPGQIKFHYSPGIPVRLNIKKPKKNEAFIQFLKSKKRNKNYFYLSKKGNTREAARELYKLLRSIKHKKYKSIAVKKIPNKGLGIAINDRLQRASYK